jgi:hypothetical protein
METFNHTPVQVAADGERGPTIGNFVDTRRPTVIPSRYDVKQRLEENDPRLLEMEKKFLAFDPI